MGRREEWEPSSGWNNHMSKCRLTTPLARGFGDAVHGSMPAKHYGENLMLDYQTPTINTPGTVRSDYHTFRRSGVVGAHPAVAYIHMPFRQCCRTILIHGFPRPVYRYPLVVSRLIRKGLSQWMQAQLDMTVIARHMTGFCHSPALRLAGAISVYPASSYIHQPLIGDQFVLFHDHF